MFTGLINDFKDAVASGFSGTSRPSRLQAKGMWVDTSQAGAPNYYWSLKIYTGSEDIELFRVSILSGVAGFSLASGTFTVTRVSVDNVGAILNLLKRRQLNSGQVLNGDTVAEFRLVGRTDTSTDPIVAYFKPTASENQTSSTKGHTLSLYSVPVTSNQLTEHLRFLQENVETTLPYKVNSYLYSSESVATAANLLLTSDYLLTELTGSTISTVHGIEVEAGETRVKTIHNRSTIEVLVKHASSTASAAQRFKLPNDADLRIPAESSMSFFYCETDQRWKYYEGGIPGLRTKVETYPDGYTEWVAPITGDVRVVAYQEESKEATPNGAKSFFSRTGLRGLVAWGANNHGQLGVGDVVDRSVPVAVIGGIRFRDACINDDYGWGLSDTGEAYAWGRNATGELGVGDVASRSSPVAIVGGVKFSRIEVGLSSYGLTPAGRLYAWGFNYGGELGVGDVVDRSSPVAVLGGLKFASFWSGSGMIERAFAVDRDTGALYGWGVNYVGSLGVGDIIDRSSPVAVLGGLKFCKVVMTWESTLGITHEGKAYAWGNNNRGQLGDGTVVAKSSPVAVLGGLYFRVIYSLPDCDTFFGLTQDGDLYAWGYNADGQLGVGDVIPRSSPVAVVGGLKWEKLARLSGGNASVIGIQRGTGAAYGWGRNTLGTAGLGDDTPRSSPVAVAGGLKFSHIHMGDDCVYGHASDGNTYGWGYNAYGQVGDNTVLDRSSPTLVQGVTEPFFEKPQHTVISVTRGQTYKLRIGGGISFFGDTKIGKNIRRISVAYEI